METKRVLDPRLLTQEQRIHERRVHPGEGDPRRSSNEPRQDVGSDHQVRAREEGDTEGGCL